jgi:hypothetical protein
MKIIEISYKNILEGILFAITQVALFTLFAEFGSKTGLLPQTLELAQMQYLGFISAGLAVLNAISGKFFEFKLVS